MTMTAQQLRERLARLPGTFILSDSDLGIATVKELFDTSLPDSTLTLTRARVVTGQLAATGTITLPGVGSGGSLAATVTFATDGHENVSGLTILVQLDAWQIATARLTVDLRLLAALKFEAVRLVLAAPSGAATDEVGVEADLPLTTTTGRMALTVRGLPPPPPPPGAPVPTSLWEFGAQLTGVTLSDLGQLAVLGSGLPAAAFGLPARVPVADDVELTRLGLVVDTRAKVIVAATVEVRLADRWTIVPGMCELEELRAAFAISYPTIAPKVSAALHATVQIAGIAVAASLTVPGLQLVAQLGEPVDVEKVFAQYFHAAAAIPIQVDWLMLTLDGAAAPPAWSVGFGVGEGERGRWALAGDVSLDDASLELAGAGTSPRSASLTATFALGATAKAMLGGAWDASTGWTLSGNTVSPDGLHIGQLLDVFASKLHAPLPAALAELELTYVGMTVATAGPSFTFQITGQLPLGAATGDFAVHVALAPTSKTVTGTLSLSIPRPGKRAETMTFAITFAGDPAKTTFTGRWSSAEGVALGDVAAHLGADVSAIPSGLLPELTSISLGYASDGPIVALGADTRDTRSVWALTGAAGTRAYFASITAQTPLRLSKLPVVGHEVPPSDDLGIDAVGLLAGSAALAPEVAQQIDALVSVSGVTLPPMPAAGLYLTVAYVVGGTAQAPLVLTLAGGQRELTDAVPSTGIALLDAASGVTGAGPPTAWMTLQRSFGPVDVQRAGVSYDDGAVWLLLDGSLRAGPLILGLEGLGAGFALGASAPWEPRFDLAGMSVAYTAPPLSIAGAIVDVRPSGQVTFELAGLLAVTAEAFSLTVFGAYAEVAGSPSMFLFGAAGAEFGGPPSFFVTGLAAGFGYNSELRMPDQDAVAEFPLVAGLADPQSFARQDPLKVLGSLVEGAHPLVSWKLGELWFAAGLKFSTYELLSSTALIVVEAGQELAIALVGTSEATFPLPAGLGATGPTYARVVLGLQAVFRPAEGTFLATAVLQKGSYVLDPACVITGGFAFAIWCAPNEHAGDFVLTLGGYHPAFRPPAWYPRERALGISWSYSDKLAITGGAYFALTPAAIMAGGALDVKFHSGDLHAWLTAHANAIVWWHPFRFSINVGITVGASYRLSVLGISTTLRVELGADLSLWGPPTGGTVRVHWWVISFTIRFGTHPPPDQAPLHWSSTSGPAFDDLLPAPHEALVVAPICGVSKPQPATPHPPGVVVVDDAAQPWIVSAYGFRFATRTAVPASTVQAGSFSQHGPALDIRPMRRTGLTCTHTVKVLDRAEAQIDLSTWTVAGTVQSGPQALWGTGAGSRLPAGEDQLVPGQLTGVSLTAPPPAEGATPGPVAHAADLESDPLVPLGWLPVAASAQPSGPVAVVDPASIATIARALASNPARSALHDALLAFDVADTTLPNGPMTRFRPGHAFEDPPMMVRT